MNADADEMLLDVRGLVVGFALPGGLAHAVDGISFAVRAREIVGLVGESGSGKSVTLLGILGLVPPPGRVVRGEVVFRGVNLLSMEKKVLREIRGMSIALIPPDASASLNPVVRVGDQIMEGIISHELHVTAGESRSRTIEILRRVGLPMPEMRARRYPHELSGGMQQRVLIASALVLGPQLVLADEPTTALDVTVQAQILELLRAVREEFGSAVLFVTHDLAIVAEICDRVLVMYAGKIVESASVDRLFAAPAHPYSRALIAAIPPLGGSDRSPLRTIAGSPPYLGSWPVGCRFAPRCELRAALGEPDVCDSNEPALRLADEAHSVACHFATVATSRPRPEENL